MDRKKLIEYYPEHLAKYRELRAVTAAEQVELDLILGAIRRGLENQYAETADEETIFRYERIYSVERIPGATLNERRFNLMARLTEQTPYTERTLSEMLSSLCGVNGFKLTVDASNYKVDAKVELTAKNNLISVKHLLKKVLPCNLIWEADLLYNQHEIFSGFTYSQLGAFTHEHLRNEVMI